MAYTYRTGLSIGVCDPADHSLPIRLTFSVYPGCAATLEQPGEAASAELLTAEVQVGPIEWVAVSEWLFSLLCGDSELNNEMLATAAEDDECARDQAADARREELRSTPRERN